MLYLQEGSINLHVIAVVTTRSKKTNVTSFGEVELYKRHRHLIRNELINKINQYLPAILETSPASLGSN